VVSITREAFQNHATRARKKFASGRNKTVGASEIGQCARKTWYAKHNMLYDEDYVDGWGAARRGNTFEKGFFVPAMRKHYGDKLLFAGGQQKRLTYKELGATPDGMLVEQPRNLLAGLMVPDIGPSRCIVVDCKTIDPRINLSQPKEEHVFQVQVQMGMFHMLTEFQPEYAVLAYTNASFFDDVVEFAVKMDAKVFENGQKRAKQIMTATSPDQLRPEGWISGGKECEYCPFYKACQKLRGAGEGDGKPPSPQLMAQIRDLAAEEREWHTRVSIAEKEHRKMQDALKTVLKDNHLRRVEESGLSVVWSPVKGRLSYDMPAIRNAAAAKGIDIQRFETVGDPTDRLTVQVIKRDRLV